MQTNPYSNKHEDFSLYVREQLFKYLKHWKWFVLGVFLCFTLAKLYLRYAIPEYKATTTVLIKGEDLGGTPPELAAFEDLGIISGGKSNLDDEMEVLKSRSLIEKTIKAGGFNVSYALEGRIKATEAYKGSTVLIDFFEKSDNFFEKDTVLTINILSDKKFELFDKNKNLINTYNFGEIIQSHSLGKFKVNKNKQTQTGQEVSVTLSSINKTIDRFRAKYAVVTLSKYSNVLELSYVDPVKERAQDFLNKLVEIYNNDAIIDKKMVSEKTANFINERLQVITEELDGVEKQAEYYKKKNKITDLPTEAELYLENSADYTKSASAVNTQLKVIDLMIDFMKKSTNSDIIPANIIPDENNSASQIDAYNNLVIEKNRILKSSTPDNPVVIRLTDKIDALKNNINQNLYRLKSSIQVKSADVRNEGGALKNRISKIPKQEREYRGIFRQQQVKEELYLYLFKKREENAITLAATAPISKVIDAAYSSNAPISPNRLLFYFFALVAGVLIPFAIIYIMNLLDTKVKSRLDVENLGLPFIGDVPHSESNNQIIQSDSRTSTAEAIRIIRTNLEFILNDVESGKAKTIFMTSTLPKEGKTFIAVNLATTIAISGKKVLLIGLDVRNPKLDEYVKLPSKGVTNYLSSKEIDVHDFLVRQKGYEHFDILPAGVIPPNPAELLMSSKVENMFNQFKLEYDYIIVDTAPVSLVTDTLLIANNADAFIYVVRANYLHKPMLNLPQDLYKDKKLPNMCILLNDTTIESGYGYGYGYGQEPEKKPWYKKILGFSFLG